MSKAIDDITMDYRSRYALITIADKVDDRHMVIFTSDRRMAEMVGMSRGAFMRARADLVDHGYAVRVVGPGRGSRKNRYRLLPWLPQGCDGTKARDPDSPCEFPGCEKRGDRTC